MEVRLFTQSNTAKIANLQRMGALTGGLLANSQLSTSSKVPKYVSPWLTTQSTIVTISQSARDRLNSNITK